MNTPKCEICQDTGVVTTAYDRTICTCQAKSGNTPLNQKKMTKEDAAFHYANKEYPGDLEGQHRKYAQRHFIAGAEYAESQTQWRETAKEEGEAYLTEPPTIVERFADNGEHSHWELINTSTGDVLWSEDEPPTK